MHLSRILTKISKFKTKNESKESIKDSTHGELGKVKKNLFLETSPISSHLQPEMSSQTVLQYTPNGIRPMGKWINIVMSDPKPKGSHCNPREGFDFGRDAKAISKEGIMYAPSSTLHMISSLSMTSSIS